MTATLRSNYIRAAAACCFFAASFWVYGSGRAMQETVGFSMREMLSAGALNVVLLVLAAAVVWLFRERLPLSPARLLWPVLGLSVVLGMVAAETWLLSDEHNFKEKVSLDPGMAYARDRAWPFHGTTLVYQPARGIHSTD